VALRIERMIAFSESSRREIEGTDRRQAGRALHGSLRREMGGGKKVEAQGRSPWPRKTGDTIGYL
jgi:hypothetical protein